jgi:MoaA/NifB/PqqE/SkfB family radical SAM enzyme
MFVTITDKGNYIRSANVEQLPISYENKIERELFGHKVLLENNPWMWHLHLKLTDACNAKCSFCVEQNSHCKENAKQFIESVDVMLTEMEKAGILFSVSVTGGEPLLFSYFVSLCDVLSKHDIKFLTMNTNGKYLSMYNLEIIDGLFDFINISRHSIDDKRNNEIFGDTMPTIAELKELKSKFKKTKMRIQCVMCDMNDISDMIEFINAFSFADDLSFRKLMKLSEKHGVVYDDREELYQDALQYVYDNFEFVEQTIQDYYIYEIWNTNGIPVLFSYSNMKMLYDVEGKEPDNICREFIIHPNGIVSGSWDYTSKVLFNPNI